MNGNLTMSVRSVLVTALVVLALAVAYLLGSGGGSTPPAQAAGDAAARPEARRLTMTGTGSATAVPDQLSFALRVVQTRPDLDDALDAASTTTARVLAALREYGVAGHDLQTTGLSMSPVYDYHPYDSPTLVGYRVSQGTSVLVERFDQGGKAVSAAVRAGGNAVRVSGIRLLVGDTGAVMARARRAAVAEAQAKAREYAEASGQALGDVVTLREVRTRPLPTSRLQDLRGPVAGMALDRALKAVPIRTGRDRTSVTVRVVWDLA